MTGAGTGAKFVGISFNGIVAGTTTNVNNNTVAAVSMTGVTGSGTSTASPFTGILVQEGNGITNNNTIGSQSATGSLTFSTTTTAATDVYGIYNFSSNAWTSNSNNVGGISVTNLGASGTFVLFGMRAFTASTTHLDGDFEPGRRHGRQLDSTDRHGHGFAGGGAVHRRTRRPSSRRTPSEI